MSEERRFQVKNFIDAEQMKRDLAYSVNDISNAMAEQASLLAHYGVIAAQAARQTDNVKLLLENTEAAVYRKLRDEAASSGEKVTEVSLEKMVTRHEKVIGAKRALNEAKQIESIAKIAVEAFRHRKDMLVQEGADQRQEMQGEIAVRARVAGAEAMKRTQDAVLQKRQNNS